MLDPGKLNRRITIQSPSTERDISGTPKKSWSDVLTTWASIRAATSREVYAVASFVSTLSHVITIRYRSGVTITHAMQVLYAGRKFEIQAVSDPDEGREQLQLLCLELNDGK